MRRSEGASSMSDEVTSHPFSSRTTQDIISQMSVFRDALNDSRRTVQELFAQGESYDPAGNGQDELQLRGMGKWRFILIRGIVGLSLPMFLYLALSDLSKDIHTAHVFHQPILRYLLGHWLFGFCMSSCIGVVIGLLAWRRLVSDTWPGTQPDSESCTTTLGPLSRHEVFK
jgi:hypothetical protein